MNMHGDAGFQVVGLYESFREVCKLCNIFCFNKMLGMPFFMRSVIGI